MVDKSFQTALVASAVIHSLLFLGISPRLLHIVNRKPENIRVSYLRTPPPPAYQQPRQHPAEKRPLIDARKDLRTAEKLINAAKADKSEFTRRQANAAPTPGEFLPKPLALREAGFLTKKRVTLPALEMSTRIKSPSYSGYYELIRERIRHAAYQNYSQTETGEVYLAFVVGTDGSLKDVRYIDDKSTPSYYLKDTAIRSIRESAPFPPFPRDLDYPQLSFNVIISFQIDE